MVAIANAWSGHPPAAARRKIYFWTEKERERGRQRQKSYVRTYVRMQAYIHVSSIETAELSQRRQIKEGRRERPDRHEDDHITDRLTDLGRSGLSTWKYQFSYDH